MKLTATIRELLITFLLILIATISFAQTFVGVSSNPSDNGSYSGTTVDITPVAGMQAGDLVVIYGEYRSTGGNLTITTTGGQTWTTEASYNSTNQRTRIFWCQYNGNWTANPVISGSNGSNPFSAIMYVFRPTYSGNNWYKHLGPTNNNPNAATVSITGLSNTVGKTVNMAFWSSPASNTWGTLTGAGWTKAGLNNQYRNTGGSDQSHTAAYQIMASAGATGNVSQTQSSSQTTNTRIISWYEVTPDACADAVTLTSNTSCTNVTGNVYGATDEAPSINYDCAGSVVYDVWYKFTAQTLNPTITLSNIGSDFLNPAMELITGSCGSMSALACGTTSITASFLTPGTTYYIRVYSSSGLAPLSATNASFDICITDPVAPAPFNDDCANAINLPIWNTCNKIQGNMAGATLSSGVSLSAPCTGTVGYDVWYKFTAVTNNAATLTLSGLGGNFNNTGIQVFSGTCGSLSPIACSNSLTVTTPSLVTGNTYYVRVFSTDPSSPNGNAGFSICATTTDAPVRFGNSYVNISKKITGGVVQPGDTLEIRFTVNHTSGTMSALRYVDKLPTHTAMLTGPTDRIRIITNEGLAYKEYSLAGGDDAATYKASPGPGEYNVRMNVGFASGSAPNAPTVMTNASTSANGQMTNSDRPKGGGGLLFATAYRVVVTGIVGDTVTLFPAQFIYDNGSGDVTLTATPFKILISDPMSLCTNNIGLNNAVENGGTFGSGTALTRSTDLTTPIAGYTFVPDVSAFPNGSSTINSVGDGRYSIVKNISPKSGTNYNAGRMPASNCPNVAYTDPLSCTNRMFGGHWDVTGDHSGTNTSAGNAPPGLNTSSGYMLEVNADYVASEVYRQTISNLCPNTYYEFSAWVRNICQTCGIDSMGNGAGNSPLPGKGNGYPGVLPNLTFALNDLDFYNTGEIDTLSWLKKGFVFKTGIGQTTATFSIRNNAQGGGGNDWALDDIAIATCLPTMEYSPSINPAVCQGNLLEIHDTVSSYFNNYSNFKWQRSTDNGGSWADITAAVDTTLTYNGETYQFITKYSIPPAHTTMADSADLYRVIVATTSSNLSNPSCLYTDASTIITLSVNDCGIPLGLDLLSFSGKLINGNAELQWVTTKENQPVYFNVEKSTDGIAFTNIATISGHGNNRENNIYNFTDPAFITDKAWYRIALYNDQGNVKYSRTILLNGQSSGFSLNNVINPFSNKLDFEVTVTQNSKVDVLLTNLVGKQVRKESFMAYEGVNGLTIPATENLSPGFYILQVKNMSSVITRKVVKK